MLFPTPLSLSLSLPFSLLISSLPLLAHTAHAFEDTSPLIAWTNVPERSAILDALEPARASPVMSRAVLEEGVDAMTRTICDGFDAIAVVDVEGLHASDLRLLGPHSHLSKRVASSTSSVQLPFVQHPVAGSAGFADTLYRNVRSACGDEGWEQLTMEDVEERGVTEGDKALVKVSVPVEKSKKGEDRRQALARADALLASRLSILSSLFPSHLIFLTSSSLISPQPDHHPSHHLSKRAPTSTPSGARELKKLGLLHRYTFFTPGLLTALLVSLGIVVPLVLLVVKQLAGVQTPDRMGEKKSSGVSGEKKMQ